MGQIAYDRVGSGEPLVLIHPLGSRRQIWAPLIARLAAEREVVAIDQPGFGESPVDEAGDDLTVADRAARLQEFFAELGLQRPHVAGNSIGGAIALELGRAGAARSVTAFSPIGFWRHAGKSWCKVALRGGDWAARHSPPADAMPLAWLRLNLFLYAFGRPFAPPAEQVLATAAGSRRSPGFRGAVEGGLEYYFADPGELAAIPVTVAWGRRDVLCTFWTQSRRARRILPEARHVTIPRGGHIPFFDAPERCAEILLRNSS
jgi:pimeloyl-ACP methyl ester carboxylesterase